MLRKLAITHKREESAESNELFTLWKLCSRMEIHGIILLFSAAI